MYTKTRELCRF